MGEIFDDEKIIFDDQSWTDLTHDLAEIAIDLIPSDTIYTTVEGGVTTFTKLGQDLFYRQILPKVEKVLRSHDIEKGNE